jgi:hypothetical protein
MERELRNRIESNLFAPARGAVEPWDGFPWHTGPTRECDTGEKHSTQALAIDVFGTLKMAPQQYRDAALITLAREMGFPDGGPWNIDLEWKDPKNRLKEPKQTQVDVLIHSPSVVIFVACKFTEPDGEPCSQLKPLRSGPNKGRQPCNGNYKKQPRPVNGKAGRCALTGKGVRYWEVIPEVFNYGGNRDYRPCPFAGPTYQLMRNLVGAFELAREGQKKPVVIVVYADAPGLPFASKARSGEWEQFAATVRPGAVLLNAISFQSIVRLCLEAVGNAGGDPATWHQLAQWVASKTKTQPLNNLEENYFHW